MFVRKLSVIPMVKWGAKVFGVPAPPATPELNRAVSADDHSGISLPLQGYADSQTESPSARFHPVYKRDRSRRGSIYRQRSTHKCLLLLVVCAVALAVLVAMLVASLWHRSSPMEVFVDTPRTKYRGFIKDVDGVPVLVFSGVPYALKADAERRFKDPAAPPSHRYIEATDPLSPCPQGPFLRNGQLDTSSRASENCLHLNVWVPRGLGDRRAVMVFYYGYSFLNGANAYKEIDGSYLSVKGDIVVVVPNYRVGVPGFLAANSTEVPGNAGLSDQKASLFWVHDNIGYFGGDPHRIVVTGQDAGAAAIGLHLMQTRANEGIVTWMPRFILHSGSPLAPLRDNTFQAKANMIQVAQRAGCAGGEDRAMVDCLKAVDVEQLVPKDVFNASEEPFGPTFRSAFLPHLPSELLNKTKIHGIQILIGTVWNEGMQPIETRKILSRMRGMNIDLFYVEEFPRLMAQYRFKDLKPALQFYTQDNRWSRSSKAQSIAEQLYGDLMYTCPVRYFAEFLANSTSPRNQVYTFVFNQRPSWSNWKAREEITRYEDLDFLFGAPFQQGSATKSEQALSRAVINTWANFAKTGTLPMVQGKPWPMFSATHDLTVEIKASGFGLLPGYRHHLCDKLREYVMNATDPEPLQ